MSPRLFYIESKYYQIKERFIFFLNATSLRLDNFMSCALFQKWQTTPFKMFQKYRGFPISCLATSRKIELHKFEGSTERKGKSCKWGFKNCTAQSYIRHKDFRSFIMLRVPYLKSEMGWTGELWQKTNILNWQNKKLHFFEWGKIQNFWIFWEFF